MEEDREKKHEMKPAAIEVCWLACRWFEGVYSRAKVKSVSLLFCLSIQSSVHRPRCGWIKRIPFGRIPGNKVRFNALFNMNNCAVTHPPHYPICNILNSLLPQSMSLPPPHTRPEIHRRSLFNTFFARTSPRTSLVFPTTGKTSLPLGWRASVAVAIISAKWSPRRRRKLGSNDQFPLICHI